jgi:hypothetical protein
MYTKNQELLRIKNKISSEALRAKCFCYHTCILKPCKINNIKNTVFIPPLYLFFYWVLCDPHSIGHMALFQPYWWRKASWIASSHESKIPVEIQTHSREGQVI